MNIKWGKLIARLLFWLSMEVLLNFLSLDNLADYSEFIERKPDIIFMS